MGPPWWVQVGVGSAVTLLGLGVSLMARSEWARWWVGFGLVLVGIATLAFTFGRYWWYFRHSYEFFDEFRGNIRVNSKEFHRWPDARKTWLRKKHPDVYRAIEEEDSCRMGPPGRPHEKWEGESEGRFALRIGARRYLGVRLRSLRERLLQRGR